MHLLFMKYGCVLSIISCIYTIQSCAHYHIIYSYKYALSCQLSIQYAPQHVKYSYTVVSSTYVCHALPVILNYMLCSPSCHIMHHTPLHYIFTCMLPVISIVRTVHSQSHQTVQYAPAMANHAVGTFCCVNSTCNLSVSRQQYVHFTPCHAELCGAFPVTSNCTIHSRFRQLCTPCNPYRTSHTFGSLSAMQSCTIRPRLQRLCGQYTLYRAPVRSVCFL